MVDNIVTASVTCAGRTKTRPLYQYDYGQVLKLTGIDLPAAYEVHFSNSEFGESTTQIGNADGVLIPDAYLQSGADVFAWLYLHSGTDDGETVYKILIPVHKRAAITPEQPTPVQQDAITQAIAALNDAVEQTAQDVEDAEAAAETAQSAAASAHNNALAAEQSAEAAAESASQAASSARTATAKAEEAATSARDAHLSQQNAEESARQAGVSETRTYDKAAEAAQSADTAAARATEAASSANAAQSAANSAAAAQTAAETAQNAAETAADEAESSADYAQEAKEAAETLTIFPATGGAAASVATITDAANDQPMALKVNILPAQAGSGTPAPDNIRAISGWTGAVITRCRKNLFDGSAVTTTYPDNWGVEFANNVLAITHKNSYSTGAPLYRLTFEPGTYVVSYANQTQVGNVSLYVDGSFYNTLSNGSILTLGSGHVYSIGFSASANTTNYITGFQIEIGSTYTAYEPYQGNVYSIAFPAEAGTVYGGTLEIAKDGSGTLTVNWAYLDGTGWNQYASADGFISYRRNNCPYGTKTSAFLAGEAYANFTDKFEIVAGMTGVQFPRSNLNSAFIRVPEGFDLSNVQLVYPTSEPQTYPLTAEQITSLFGTNNVWADCGDTQITAYTADKTLLITAAEQRIENLTVSSETLPAGSPATVEKQESADGINLHFGIPKGEDGQSGGVTDVRVNGTSVLSGGVANIPEASASTYGVVKTGTVSVSGTTPTITALSGIQYVCGEVSTLDITPPASGIVDVVFESGSTPTVLTITPPTGMTVEWANGFDSANLEADTLYELNIKMVGSKCLGVAGQWS